MRRLSRVRSPFGGGASFFSSSDSLRRPLPSRFTTYVSRSFSSGSLYCFHEKNTFAPSGVQRTSSGDQPTRPGPRMMLSMVRSNFCAWAARAAAMTAASTNDFFIDLLQGVGDARAVGGDDDAVRGEERGLLDGVVDAEERVRLLARDERAVGVVTAV